MEKKKIINRLYYVLESKGLTAPYQYYMMCREGFLLKLQRIGIEGRFYNWVLSF